VARSDRLRTRPSSTPRRSKIAREMGWRNTLRGYFLRALRAQVASSDSLVNSPVESPDSITKRRTKHSRDLEDEAVDDAVWAMRITEQFSSPWR
jgi:hypothetical protein